MTMRVEIETDKKTYTMEALGIQKGSKEASIFNKVDISDGRQDNYLTEQQKFMYQKSLALDSIREQERLAIEKEKKLVDEQKMQLELAQFLNENHITDYKINSQNNTITINSLGINNYDISSEDQITKLKLSAQANKECENRLKEAHQELYHE